MIDPTRLDANAILAMIDRALHSEPEPPQPLDLNTAQLISRLITARSVAQDGVNRVLNDDDDKFDNAKFNRYRQEHIEASNQLGALGIFVNTYEGDVT
jgi:hypothetical protein